MTLKPEMSAYEVCEKFSRCNTDLDKYDVIITQLCKSGYGWTYWCRWTLLLRQLRAVDECVGKAVEAVKEVDGTDVYLCRPRKCRTADR